MDPSLKYLIIMLKNELGSYNIYVHCYVFMKHFLMVTYQLKFQSLHQLMTLFSSANHISDVKMPVWRTESGSGSHLQNQGLSGTDILKSEFRWCIKPSGRQSDVHSVSKGINTHTLTHTETPVMDEHQNESLIQRVPSEETVLSRGPTRY